MAKQSRKNQGPWQRMRLWMHNNQRILWVVLLVFVCFSFGFVGPVQNFFMSAAKDASIATVYGAGITRADVQQTQARLSNVRTVLAGASQASFFRPLPGALSPALASFNDLLLGPFDFFIFRDKARRMGFRVSNAELADYVRALWRKNEAVKRASMAMAEDIKKARTRRDMQMLSYQLMSKASEEEEKLKSEPFDVESWAQVINGGRQSQGRRRRILPADFEETLRDVVLIAKLKEYIQSSVQVSPREVFEEFRKENQVRRISWSEAPVTDDLKEAVSATITEEDLRRHYTSNRDKFRMADAIKTRWLLLPKEHFEKIASDKITDAELKKYFEENRNDYRRPVVLPAEASFLPRTAKAQEELEKAIYLDLDEVKDKVREKVLERKARSELLDFAEKLRLRLHPPKKESSDRRTLGGDQPATFEELVKEFPFLKTGATGFVPEEEARDSLGDGYSSQISQWFRSISKAQGVPKVEAPLHAVSSEKGMVFYAGVVHRRPTVPLLSEIEGQVRDSAVLQESLSLLEDSLKGRATEINEKKMDFGETAASPLKVTVGKGDAARVVEIAMTAPQRSRTLLGKTDTLMVEVKKDAEEKKSDEASDGPEEEPHAGSRAIIEAAFSVDEGGRVVARVSTEAGAGYLVRTDDIVPPDPADFEKFRKRLEMTLLGERQRNVLVQWRRGVQMEARGSDYQPEEPLESSTPS